MYINSIFNYYKAIAVLAFTCILNSTNAQVADIRSADTIPAIVKYGVKSMTTMSYKADDSTLNNAQLDTKQISTYDKAGNMVESSVENAAGRIISRTTSRYDAKNNLIESISYDSLNRISYQYKNQYDAKNTLVAMIVSQPLSLLTSKPEDADKYTVYTYRYKYDDRGNNIESVTDSAGVEKYKTVARFNDKGQALQNSSYDHGVLHSATSYVYDSKGGYSVTEEYYMTPSRTECSPSKNKSISRFTAKGEMISSLNISEQNGVVTTTKTTNTFKYVKDKMISYKSVTETYGEGFSSKQETSDLYKHDKNGNVIETISQYSGSKYIEQSKFNSNNLVTEIVTFSGSCNDKPTSKSTYAYYPDGKTLKEYRSETFDYPSTSVTIYDERSFYLEDINLSPYGSTHNIYKYEYWK